MTEWKKIFTIIWSGQIFSTFSSMTVGYAVVFWLSTQTRSAEVLAIATISSLLPQLFIGPLAGVLIDRWDRRSIMICADLFIAACTGAIAVLLSKGDLDITWFYLLLMLRSAASAFHVPAMQASIPLLAPETELMRISGVNQTIQSGSIIASPPLAALLISSFSMTWVLLLDVIGAVIASISLVLVRIPNPSRKEGSPAPHVLRDMLEGLQEIYSRKGILWLFLICIGAMFFIMPISALFPLLTLKHFMGGAFHVSYIEVAWGVGMLIGGAILGMKLVKLNEIVLLNSTVVLLGLTFTFSGILPPGGYWVFFGMTLLGGVSMSIYSGVFIVVLQTTIEPSALGRVFSISGSLSLIPAIIGLLYTGKIADGIGISNAFLISGVMICVLGALSFFIPAIKDLSSSRSEANEPIAPKEKVSG